MADTNPVLAALNGTPAQANTGTQATSAAMMQIANNGAALNQNISKLISTIQTVVTALGGTN